MLLLSDIRDWLKSLDAMTVKDVNKMKVCELNKCTPKQLTLKDCIIADYFYIGKLDNKKQKSIGIYQLKSSSGPKVALGGLENTKTFEKTISILIHWNNNAKETEQKAIELYYKLFNLKNFKINNIKIDYIKLLVPEPIDVGTDDANIYERVIEATFYYQREEN